MSANQETAADWGNLSVFGKAALVSAGTFITIGLFSMGSALPVLARDFDKAPHSVLLIQLIASVMAPVFAFTSPIAGRAVSRYGVRSVYLTSLLLFVIGGTAPAACNGLFAMLAFRVVLALGVAGVFTAGMAGIAKVPIAQRPLLLGLTSFFGGAIAIAIFPVVGMLSEYSWRAAFFVHLVLLPVYLLVLRLPEEGRVSVEQARGVSSKGLLAGVPVWLLVIAGLVGLPMVASAMYSPFYLASIGVTEPARIGRILSVMAICSLIGSGTYSHVHRLLGTSGMVYLALGAVGSGCVTVGLSQVLPSVVVGLGLMGMGLAIFGAAGYGAAIEVVGAQGDTDSAMGIVTCALYGAQILFPVLASSVGVYAGPGVLFAVLGVLMLGAILLMASSRKALASPA